MIRISIPFVQEKGDIPIVQFDLKNGEKITGILDSGSDSTIIDHNFVEQNKEHFAFCTDCPTISYSGMFSSEKKSTLYVKASMYFKKVKLYTDITFSVLDISEVKKVFTDVYDVVPNAIFGSDFLSAHNAEIDYRNKKLLIDV